MQFGHPASGIVRDRRRAARLLPRELELHGGADEEAVRAVEHPKLAEIDARGCPRPARHGRQYTHAPMPSDRPTPDLAHLRAGVAAGLDRYLAELEAMVAIDSGSYTRDGVNRVADHVAAALAELGARVERHVHQPVGDEPPLGDLVVGHLAGDGPRILLIGHMDTVFDPGTAAERPYRRVGDRATGPGTSDMKGGLLAGLLAVRALAAADVGHR